MSYMIYKMENVEKVGFWESLTSYPSCQPILLNDPITKLLPNNQHLIHLMPMQLVVLLGLGHWQH